MNTDEIYEKLLASEYVPKASRKLIALRKLDKKAKQPTVIFTYILGVIATLIFGIGICLLTVYFVMPTSMRLYLGILLFTIGLLAMTFNCFLFKKCSKRQNSGMRLKLLNLQKIFAIMTYIKLKAFAMILSNNKLIY